jgi:hypothetical protein
VVDTVHLMRPDNKRYDTDGILCCEVCGKVPGLFTVSQRAHKEIKATGQLHGEVYTACTVSDAAEEG